MQSSRPLRQAMVALTLVLLPAPQALAGMTVYGLRDIYRLRLEEISFFIVLLLVCSIGLKFLWNHAFKGMSSIPRLRFPQALCASLIFGLLTLLILTMISGIREVLTPGAWRKQGTSYRLNDPSQQPARERSLQHLRTALLEYARSHDGRFPPHDYVPEIAEKLWESPDQHGSHYIYSGGLTTNDVDTLLAFEPPNFGDQRFVLRVSGEVELLNSESIEAERRAQP